MSDHLTKEQDEYLLNNGYFRIPSKQLDASSIFRIISEHIYDTPNYHPLIRQQCVNFMANKQNRLIFEKLIDDDYDKYLLELSYDKTFGTNIELLALGLRYERNVQIFNRFTLGNWLLFNPKYDDSFLLFYTPPKQFDGVIKFKQSNAIIDQLNEWKNVESSIPPKAGTLNGDSNSTIIKNDCAKAETVSQQIRPSNSSITSINCANSEAVSQQINQIRNTKKSLIQYTTQGDLFNKSVNDITNGNSKIIANKLKECSNDNEVYYISSSSESESNFDDKAITNISKNQIDKPLSKYRQVKGKRECVKLSDRKSADSEERWPHDRYFEEQQFFAQNEEKYRNAIHLTDNNLRIIKKLSNDREGERWPRYFENRDTFPQNPSKCKKSISKNDKRMQSQLFNQVFDLSDQMATNLKINDDIILPKVSKLQMRLKMLQTGSANKFDVKKNYHRPIHPNTRTSSKISDSDRFADAEED